MNPHDADAWKVEALEVIFRAMAGSPPLVDCLVFKGARVLSLRLVGGRQSYDIDSNLTTQFVASHPDPDRQREFLADQLAGAVEKQFGQESPVRFHLDRLRIESVPLKGRHPMGWDAWIVKLTVNDLSRPVRGLPALEIDVAAPETLLPTSIAPIIVGDYEVLAYTLERIAGEKLRAFLTTLPAYRAKFRKPGQDVRVKDLYDLALILRHRPITQLEFWQTVGREFRVACESRYVDCAGLESFHENWEVTRKSYGAATIPNDIDFAEAEQALETIVGFLIADGVIPFEFLLPDGSPTWK